jgi:hypothetical protein
MRSTAARENLTEITPALLKSLAATGNPDAAVGAFDNLLRALPTGAQLFALLRNNHDLLELLATILGVAPTLAEVFARRRATTRRRHSKPVSARRGPTRRSSTVHGSSWRSASFSSRSAS